MKTILLILAFLFSSCHTENDEYHMTVWTMITKIPMPEYHRKVTGYDSIQLVIRHGKLEANFCYPNEWEFEKWRILNHDSAKRVIYIYDTIKPIKRINSYGHK